jgi:hypothetical protein
MKKMQVVASAILSLSVSAVVPIAARAAASNDEITVTGHTATTQEPKAGSYVDLSKNRPGRLSDRKGSQVQGRQKSPACPSDAQQDPLAGLDCSED